MINRRPWGGAFEVSYDAPAVALSTPITLSAGSSWTDDASDLPLSYSFAYAAAIAPTRRRRSARRGTRGDVEEAGGGELDALLLRVGRFGRPRRGDGAAVRQEVKLDAAKLAELTNDMTRASAEGDAEGGTFW